jgi:hypothetical protein
MKTQSGLMSKAKYSKQVVWRRSSTAWRGSSVDLYVGKTGKNRSCTEVRKEIAFTTLAGCSRSSLKHATGRTSLRPLFPQAIQLLVALPSCTLPLSHNEMANSISALELLSPKGFVLPRYNQKVPLINLLLFPADVEFH